MNITDRLRVYQRHLHAHREHESAVEIDAVVAEVEGIRTSLAVQTELLADANAQLNAMRKERDDLLEAWKREAEKQEPVYQISLTSGATSTAWIDCNEADYNSARLMPKDYRTRKLYTRTQPLKEEGL